MSPKQIAASTFSRDTLDLFRLLDNLQVKYLIIGGYAVNYYGHLRLTGDVDIYFSNTEENVSRLYNALSDFWGGNIPNLTQSDDLKESDLILQYGIPPNRIDLMNTVDGIDFNEAWNTREDVSVQLQGRSLLLHYISLDLLIKNKEKIQRPKDFEDLEYLKAAKAKRQMTK
jgi:hypothetical protein